MINTNAYHTHDAYNRILENTNASINSVTEEEKEKEEQQPKPTESPNLAGDYKCVIAYDPITPEDDALWLPIKKTPDNTVWYYKLNETTTLCLQPYIAEELTNWFRTNVKDPTKITDPYSRETITNNTVIFLTKANNWHEPKKVRLNTILSAGQPAQIPASLTVAPRPTPPTTPRIIPPVSPPLRPVPNHFRGPLTRHRVMEIIEYYSAVGGRPNFRGANLSGLNLRGLNFIGADMSGANLNGVDFFYTMLSHANFQGASMRHTNLQTAILMQANLRKADLQHANLTYANLVRSDLSETNLSKADLSSAVLLGANLKNATLRHAKIEMPRFNSDSNLMNADFRKARLSYAADIVNVPNWREAQFGPSQRIQLARYLMDK